jgi:hypothetical protein
MRADHNRRAGRRCSNSSGRDLHKDCCVRSQHNHISEDCYGIIPHACYNPLFLLLIINCINGRNAECPMQTMQVPMQGTRTWQWGHYCKWTKATWYELYIYGGGGAPTLEVWGCNTLFLYSSNYLSWGLTTDLMDVGHHMILLYHR